ncbi:alpha-glucuronidase family glycosyl hydrolase [Granulicella arctica]|uniref:Xylan alpha-1,2-glucuronidase n=1 Tax=Granulicella arctica TaxID=940613 RepID=A0A7Y9PL61_9BACT|nr:alpha-glucuronidase family glycosyl hydrolase [Granulicella arctica]NYF81126.1 alpha-glucuronidase [Granulicella arctica]
MMEAPETGVADMHAMGLARHLRILLLLMPMLVAASSYAEDGHEGWLRYAHIDDPVVLRQYDGLPHRVLSLGTTPVAQAASTELVRGMESMLGSRLVAVQTLPQEDAFVLGTQTEVCHFLRNVCRQKALSGDAFAVVRVMQKGHVYWVIFGDEERGELYGVFHVLEQFASQKPIADASEAPAASVRWVNQWDNFDGSIERGYAGRSIFFDGGHVRADLSRVSEYGRLLASVGLNGCTVNNVNSDLRTLDPAMLRELARIADQLRPWGVRMSLSVDLSSPQIVDHLATFDPLDPAVVAWWQKTADEVYRLIPDFGGFVIKADSEGRLGPSKYGRTPAEAANVVARALRPHGGVVLYRGFVYNNHLDWHDLKADRARAGYDNFHALDGRFEPNVIIQIKHGPIDFQVREPLSPLFAALQHTSQAIELQVTQEYTGQQRHMVFLVPMWKAALDTDLRAQNRSTPVKEIVEGRSFHQPLGGFAGVVNVGLDTNWMHHPMAMSNLYGFGKLAWNPDLTSDEILDSWTRLTWGNNPKVVSTIDDLQRGSWHAYEEYSGPLGLGTLTNIIGIHYGPGIESAERNGWGQWLRADNKGIGIDRTVATGTGYIGQYPPELAKVYESLTTCPDELLLFMHHVPYNYVLHNGKTVVQHVYDSHYKGAATVATYAPRWEQLQGLIDEERYEKTLKLFMYQAGHAIVWRDAVSEWFLRMSGIADTRGRVGHYPNRIEAESMQADGYTSVDVTPWETASGGKAVVCNRAAACTLTVKLDRPVGSYKMAVQYFDLRVGDAQYELLLDGKPIAHWIADDILPPAVVDTQLDGSTSTRFTVSGIALKPGDTLMLRGTPNNGEPAPVDYIEIMK